MSTTITKTLVIYSEFAEGKQVKDFALMPEHNMVQITFAEGGRMKVYIDEKGQITWKQMTAGSEEELFATTAFRTEFVV